MARTRARTKEARRLVRRITAAGGQVTYTRNGHLRVTGPTGVAVVQSEYGGPNALRGALAEIARHAGLDLRGVVL